MLCFVPVNGKSSSKAATIWASPLYSPAPMIVIQLWFSS
jgi:hypothetical protein